MCAVCGSGWPPAASKCWACTSTKSVPYHATALCFARVGRRPVESSHPQRQACVDKGIFHGGWGELWRRAPVQAGCGRHNLWQGPSPHFHTLDKVTMSHGDVGLDLPVCQDRIGSAWSGPVYPPANSPRLFQQVEQKRQLTPQKVQARKRQKAKTIDEMLENPEALSRGHAVHPGGGGWHHGARLHFPGKAHADRQGSGRGDGLAVKHGMDAEPLP